MSRMLIFMVMLFLTISFSNASVPDGYSKVKELGGIEEFKLESNDLTVLLMEDHSAPVLTFMVTFHVGSRNEVTGTTGSTHLLEHLMFKGTPRFNKANGGHIDNLLGNVGAMLNATTWTDRTNYYESIPSEYLETTVEFEADRMRNLLLLKEDKEAEMTVVRNEYERGENSPYQTLDKEIFATAFQAHPYHHSTIGWKSDIENVTMEKLRDFYNTFYWPNNATVTVIGDFDKTHALELIKKYYGKISKSPNPIPELYTVEPKQEGQRRVTIKRPGQLGVVGIGWKIPGALNADTYSLAVLDNIMQNGKNSRMYKALIDNNKASNAFDDHSMFKDPSLYISYAFLAPGVTHDEVEKIILAEFDKIKKEGVTDAEVTRAKSQIKAATAFGRDGSFSIASRINESIARGDWTFYTNYLDNIRKVTAEDVKRVANEYFIEDHSTTGHFIPVLPGGGKDKPGPSSLKKQPQFYRTPGMETPAAALSPVQPQPTESSIAKNIERKNINGIDVITSKTGVKDVVTITGSMAGGDIFSPGDNGMIADLTGRMLDKGTTKNDKFALAEKLENLGATLRFGIDKYNVTFNARCLKKDVSAVIDLLAEQLRMPAFSEEELVKLKKQTEANLKRQLESTNSRATEKLNRLIFSEDHPNYDETIENLIEQMKAVTIGDVKAFHKKFYGPKSMIFVAAGDVDSEMIQKSLKNAFAGWDGGVTHKQYEQQTTKTKSGKHIVTMEGKTSTSILIGQASGLKRTDKDGLPFYLGNTIFGTGFAGRLMSIIRDDEGLTYGIYSTHTSDIYSDGKWFIGATFAPNLLDQGLKSTMREFKRWVNEGVTAKELQSVKKRLTGRYKVGLATSRGMAAQILGFIQQGYDVEYMDNFPNEINKVTLEQVNNAIKKYIDPDAAVTVIAGSVDQDGKPLSKK
ncbi:MAG: insulinase family protein [Calditrichaeota bacterium]|nr:MAG: insulinase family protein [Calditrichota bacterium]MBL1207500.1 insulinase family protein [Calditrichota bacterium]NOG47332.1 insulinase family protein [Calditrichota bacterium]